MRKDISRLTRLTTEMEGLLYVIEHRGDNNGSVHAALVEKYDEFRSLMEAELKAFLAEHEEESETGTPSVAQSRKADTAEEVAAADNMNTEADRLCTNAFAILDDADCVEVAKEDEGVSGEVLPETDAADAAISREEKSKKISASQEERALEDIDTEEHNGFSPFQATIPGLDEQPVAQAVKSEAKPADQPAEAEEGNAFSFRVEFNEPKTEDDKAEEPKTEEPAKAPAETVTETISEKAADVEPQAQAANQEPEKQKISVTINDVLSARPGELRLDEMLSRREARTLRKAFTLNDKFRFRRELFKGDDALFGRTLDAIQQEPSYDDAVEYMQTALGWDMKNPDVADFMAIVRNHFNSL